MSKGPTHDLLTFQTFVRAQQYVITDTAADSARGDFGFAEADVVRCVLGLDSGMFYKTMDSKQRPGYWQDVYRVNFESFDIYVKLSLSADSKAIVISFKKR